MSDINIIIKYHDSSSCHRCYWVDLFLCLVFKLLRAIRSQLQTQKVHQLKHSVEGMNFDFLAMNLTGFTFYSLYCSYGYFSGNDQQTGRVDLNDVIFSYHALAITIITVIQAFVFPQGKNKILKITIAGLSLMWVFCIVYSCLSMVGFY